MHQINYKIESKFDEVESACTTLKSFCENNNLQKFITELQLVLTEALNNIIEHAYKNKKGNFIEIQLEYSENKITITLSDEGVQNHTEIKKELKFDPEDLDSLPERGMGLFIINKIMSKIEYHRSNNKNTFILIKHLS